MNWPIAIEGTITIVGISGLIYYRLNRKFKNEKVAGFWSFLDRNIVEIIIGMTLIPDWKLILELLR